ncbi:NAD(+) diphosphatase [Rufibacter glacialis]|uniref:NAD(+) diphosphatase n=1 Tax=Rufibacter glacialis TaxID=1259555 RepID=A0A5M8QIG5_9BACT|nr:NAD(+) diphosphatase [Rufibacter glacialis]KAA6435819.1 NAD(+) diphosphatase [Rufibacter glacialis]GGK66855.1 NADH pyrophosphatase [Rufibacter glacialis]
MRNHLAYSALNYFGASDLDRVHLLRKNPAWLATQLTHPDTVLLPFQHLKPLLTSDRQLVPVTMKEVNWDLGQLTPILLGVKGDRAYFALDLQEGQEIPVANGSFQELREATLQLARPDSSLLAYAKAMVYWHRQQQFCSVCGTPTFSKDAGHVRQCPNPTCHTSHFPRTDTAVITMVTCGDLGLLARQASWPTGQYASVAGFLEPGETLETAVAREVQEEVGLRVKQVEYHSSQPWPFPASIMVGFTAEAESTHLKIDPEEIEDARWFTRPQLKELIASGDIKLPPALSISYRLIQDWLNGAS